MMVLSTAYIAKNLLARRLTTFVTALGLALVNFVLATALMMAHGLEKTLVATGSPDNLLITRRGSQAEIQSAISRYKAAIIGALPGIATRADGSKILSREPVTLVNFQRRNSTDVANIVVRGVGVDVLQIRPQVRISRGRMFRPGTAEIVVGHSIANAFSGAQLGESLRFAMHDWTIVGIFEGGDSGFDSEIWGESEQIMQAFHRDIFSSMLIKMRDAGQFKQIKNALEADPRLNVVVQRETQFYADQSEDMANFIRVLGTSITLIFSIGATIGAAITMYASVANRTREIGTLRALGFTRDDILRVFLTEAILIGVVGGVMGLVFASLMRFVKISTTNLQTFAEIVFYFRLSPSIILVVIMFAVFMGFSGGFLPAMRAAKLNIVDALRAT